MIAETLAAPDFLEPHYTLSELAQAWHMSRRSLRPLFIEEKGVIKYGTGKLNKGRKRTHLSLRIPQSVARRVHLRITGEEWRHA